MVVLLTGTDLYDFPREELVEVGMAADALVVMHELAMRSLPSEMQARAHVIYPSVELPRLQVNREPGLVTQIGHLRPVKNPFMALRSLQESEVQLVQIGEALSPDGT